MSYVSQWEKLKKDFENATGSERPKQTKETIFGTIQKASGITPVLKDLDAAIAKKQRAPIAQAITKFLAARGPYVEMLMRHTRDAMLADDMALATAYKDFQTGLGKMSVDAGKELNELQEAKAPGKTAIPFFEIEGDVKATIATAKKDLAAFAALEKKHKILATADLALKETEKYTKAAARTEYKEAAEALTKFKVFAKKCAEDLAKPITAEKTNEKFVTAVQKFQKGMKDFSAVTRVDQHITLLKKLENEG